MGIKGLWNLLTPFCDKKPLYELEGQVVAIDLACWICEALTVVEYHVQPRFYLRNLYFRTHHLLLMGVRPVFVLDGKAPTLKYDTIAARNNIQFKGARPKTNGQVQKQGGKDRTRFNAVLKQCEELLNIMGIKCVHGWGEAEAMCAYLNADGFVDACITQDSDCFAYGAQIVYRNFSLSQQGIQANKGGAIDIYDIRKVPNLGRQKMVALALMCGCDYNENGVNGIGLDSVMKFLNLFNDDEVLERIKSWRTDVEKFNQMELEINSPDICTSCGHAGKVQKHGRVGCLICKTDKGCDNSNGYKEKRLQIKNELNIRSKALLDDNFPNQELIDEFMERKGKMPAVLDLSWSQPNLIGFVKFVLKKLDWPEIYALEKFLPLLTRWQLLNHSYVKNNKNKLKGVLYPDFIKKKCRPKGVCSYQIVWKDEDHSFIDLLSKDQINEWKETNKQETIEGLWTTVEPEHLVQEAYPDLVETFLASKVKKKPEKRRKKKNEALEDLEDLNDSLHRLFISKKPNKPSKPKSSNLIDKYFKKKVEAQIRGVKLVETKETDYDPLDELASNINEMSICDKLPEPEVICSDEIRSIEQIPINEEKKESQEIPSYEKLSDSFLDFNETNISANFNDDDDLDLSGIIENIVSRKLVNLIALK